MSLHSQAQAALVRSGHAASAEPRGIATVRIATYGMGVWHGLFFVVTPDEMRL